MLAGWLAGWLDRWLGPGACGVCSRRAATDAFMGVVCKVCKSVASGAGGALTQGLRRTTVTDLHIIPPCYSHNALPCLCLAMPCHAMPCPGRPRVASH